MSSDQREAGGAIVADLKPDNMLPFSDRIGPCHVVLVGVAAVGKTTLGRATAPLVGLPFADTDLTMEEQYGTTIDELSRKPDGDARIDGLLWETYQALVNVRPPTLIAAPPRLLGRRDFWRLTRERAVSVHLRSTPLRVLRQDMALRHDVPVSEVVVTDSDRIGFSEYYWWRLRHGRKADYELRLTGLLQDDVQRLAELVRSWVGTTRRHSR
jgi:shikimate kinase